MAEFALILPVLVMLVFGIIEFGIAFNRAQAVEAAAREGARLASLSTTTDAAVQARVEDALSGITLDNLNVDVPTGLCAGRQGQTVKVSVTADHDISIPLVFDRTVVLTGEAVFRCEA